MQLLELRSIGFQQLHGKASQFPTTLQLKLSLEIGAMGLDSLDAAVKLFGNLAGAEAKSNQVQDFELAFAQSCKGGKVNAARRYEPLRQPTVHGGAKVDVSRQDLLYGQQDIAGALLLHQVAVGA